jgi:hypothetical protein
MGNNNSFLQNGLTWSILLAPYQARYFSSNTWLLCASGWIVFWKKRSNKLSSRSANKNRTGVEVAMLTNSLQTLWDQMSPEQRARIIAILVEMLLRQWRQGTEAPHDRA